MATQNIKFANVTIPQSRVFYQRQHVFAMVLHNQVLPDHILLCLRQPEVRFSEISTHQLFDLTLAIKELSECMHERFSNQKISITTVVQDFERDSMVMNRGIVAAQANGNEPVSLPQLHVHLIPRQSSHNMSNEQLNACIETFGITFLHRQNSNEQALANIAENYRRTLEEMGIDTE